MDPSFEAEQVLSFWFEDRSRWWKKSASTDALIRDRFGPLHEAATERQLDGWRTAPRSRLALILVLDQFSRNLFRNDATAWAHDGYAQELVQEGLASGMDQTLSPIERAFFYMPLMHAEDLALQDECVRRFKTLAEEPGADFSEHAEMHRDLIKRFGRFPHRNALLGRESTKEERDFLEAPGGFKG